MAVPLFALLASTLFAGAALYITLVEQPARMLQNNTAMLGHWQPSYKRALPIQSGLAILGGLLGVIAWYLSRDWQYLAGSLVLLANWPFTLIGIMPTNKRLMVVDAADANEETRSLLHRWGRLHAARSALGSIAAGLFVWGLLAAP